MTSVEVIIPWDSVNPHRASALERILRLYAARHGSWLVSVVGRGESLAPADSKGLGGLTDARFCKAELVMPAIEASSAEIVVVADADVWTEGLSAAVSAVVCGVCEWSVPHRLLRRLDELTSSLVCRYGLEALAGDELEPGYAERPRDGRLGGGIVVAQPQTLLEAPLDPRFRGWGQEDTSWALALRTLAGDPWRGDAELLHFWHPPAQRMSRMRGSPEGWRLYRRYLDARGDPGAMQRLIEEGRACRFSPAT